MTQKLVRILIIGARGVGKSALIYRFITNSPYDDNPVFDGHTTLRLDDEEIRIEVVEWKEDMDFESEQNFFDAVAIVFSTTDTKSFYYALDVHKYTIQQQVDIPVLLLEGKVDEIEKSELNGEEVLDAVRKSHTKLYRVSVKENFNVIAAFAHLVEQALQFQSKDVNRNHVDVRRRSSRIMADMPSEERLLKRRDDPKERKKCSIM